MHNEGSFIGSPNVEELINHPAHISDRNTISAFIPFCSFGFNVDLIGEKLSNFQVPVCSLFRKKIFSGQVCYEADLNQFKNKIDWKRALKKGFSFILDTNDEYDVKNLFQRKSRHLGSRLPVDHGAGQTVPPRQGENHRGCQGRSEGFQSDQMDLPCH